MALARGDQVSSWESKDEQAVICEGGRRSSCCRIQTMDGCTVDGGGESMEERRCSVGGDM